VAQATRAEVSSGAMDSLKRKKNLRAWARNKMCGWPIFRRKTRLTKVSVSFRRKWSWQTRIEVAQTTSSYDRLHCKACLQALAQAPHTKPIWTTPVITCTTAAACMQGVDVHMVILASLNPTEHAANIVNTYRRQSQKWCFPVHVSCAEFVGACSGGQGDPCGN